MRDCPVARFSDGCIRERCQWWIPKMVKVGKFGRKPDMGNCAIVVLAQAFAGDQGDD